MGWNRHFPISHHELNYLTSEEVALLVREHVRPHLDMDEAGVGCANYAYPVHTIYLDSEDLKLYWKAINDSEHRCELRVRQYSRYSETPIRIEIKRRASAVVLREGCLVKPEAVHVVLSGQFPDPADLVEASATSVQALQNFVKLKERINARPVLRISYLRECFIDAERGSTRVTMDREIACQATTWDGWQDTMAQPSHPFGSQVLLELNFSERFPDWFREMVQTLNLTECEADKYVAGMTAIGGRSGGPPCDLPFE